jgi:uncharacterized protein with NRDE domain
MCTLMLALRALPGTRLAVSANRNEFLARPASPIALWPAEGSRLRFAAPRDLQAGGTWQGVNERGLIVCVTNRRGAQLSPHRASRGNLVLAALACESAREAQAMLAAEPGDRYNGFHLVAADRREAVLLIGDGERIESRALDDGVHVITERSFGAGEGLREEVARREFAALFANAGALQSPEARVSLAALRAPLAAHVAGSPPLESACVHADEYGYGTRSSLQLLVRDGGEVGALFSEGHTCTSQPRDVSALLGPLFPAAARP